MLAGHVIGFAHITIVSWLLIRSVSCTASIGPTQNPILVNSSRAYIIISLSLLLVHWARKRRTMTTHLHQSSLEGVLDFSLPFSLTSEQHESARNLVIGLTQHYGPERTVRKGYRPATLIQATLEHVASPDTFMTFFLSYVFDVLCPKEGTTTDSDITHILSYFEGFSSWDSEQINKLHEGLEKFGDYIIENFLLPRKWIICLHMR